MANDWIIDVIADLKTFAARKGLSALANQLDESMLVAAIEIASNEEKVPDATDVEIGKSGNLCGAAAGRQHA